MARQYAGPSIGASRPGVRVAFTGDTTGLEGAVRQASGLLQGFGKSVQNIGIGIASAFSVNAIAGFIASSAELASTMQGVEEAFNRIAKPGLLDQLQEATRGTVDNLQLMRQTVRANNFQIPLEQLATLFDFATKRAAQTGESVDYLVESIILGIGRKSPLILDNLGISAVRLREKLRGVGVETASVAEIAKIMGEIIGEEMAKMGDVTLTAAQKIQQYKAEWINLKLAIGDVVAPVVGAFFSKLSREIQQTITEVETLKDSFGRLIDVLNTEQTTGRKTLWSLLRDIFTFGTQEISRAGSENQSATDQFSADFAERMRQIQKKYEVGPSKEGFIDFMKLIEESKPSEEELERLRVKFEKEQEELRKLLEAVELGRWKWAEEFADDIKKLNTEFEKFIQNLETLPTLDMFEEAEQFEPPGLTDQDNRYLEFWNSTTLAQNKALEQQYADLEYWLDNNMITYEQYLEGINRLSQDSSDKIKETTEDTARLLSSLGSAFGNAIGDMVVALSQGEQDTSDIIWQMVGNLIASAATIIAAYLAETAAATFAAGAQAGGAFGAITGTAAAAAAVAAFSAIVPSIWGMVEGGIVPPGFPNDTYPAFLTSGERVVPPDKLDQMGGVVQLQGRFIIQGKDLVYIVNQENSKLERYR